MKVLIIQMVDESPVSGVLPKACTKGATGEAWSAPRFRLVTGARMTRASEACRRRWLSRGWSGRRPGVGFVPGRRHVRVVWNSAGLARLSWP